MKEKLMKNVGYLVALLDVGIYFILSYVFVSGFENNILTILVNGALLFVGAMVATSAMTNQGLLNGNEAASYKETLSAHLLQKQKIYPKLNFLQAWLDYDYIKLLRIGRSVYVNSAGFDYREIFDDKGKVNNEFKLDKPNPKIYTKWWQKVLLPFLKFSRWIFGDEWRVYREKRRFIKKAKHYKITRLTVSDLMNVDVDKDPNNFGITEKQYALKKNSASALSRFVLSCLLPCISWGFVGFDIKTFLVQLMSIILILIGAIFSMFRAYFFKVKTHRNSIIQKINKMEEFDNATNLAELVKSNKEEQSNVCAKIPIFAKGNVVEEIPRNDEFGKTNDICGN